MIVLALLAIVSCGGGSSSSPSCPDVTGLWSGAWGSSTSPSFDIDITYQSGQDFGGYWKYSSETAWPSNYVVDGYAFACGEGNGIVYFDIRVDSIVDCGSYSTYWRRYEVQAYYNNGSVIDNSALYSGCNFSNRRSITLTHQ